jgi:UDP-N-acetylmuramate dehydrogenase
MANDPGDAAVTTGFSLVEHAPLRHRNTLRVDAHATLLAEVDQVAALPALLGRPEFRGRTPLILGEGSNVLFAGDFDGVVVTLKTRGAEVLNQDGDGVRIRVAAGEHWDGFVRWTLRQGHPGLENLILIPGSAGAAPMQNIGAYGTEIGEFIESVEAFDLIEHRFVTFENAECRFGYRDSRFKREPDHWLITALTLRLPGKYDPRIDYAGLREELARMGVARPAPVHVAEAVVNLRTRKLPDPAVIGNAGSFFKNPVLPASEADALRRGHPQLAVWPVDDRHSKLSAAWLIESCGFKGLREGDAGVSSRHALVLVNHGQATGAQLWALAQRVREGVRQRYGILLEPEPRIIGGPAAA